jgi:hypothetical protein
MNAMLGPDACKDLVKQGVCKAWISGLEQLLTPELMCWYNIIHTSRCLPIAFVKDWTA